MSEIPVSEAAKQLKTLFDAALKGERIVIVEEGGAVELVPVKPGPRGRRFGSARGVFEIPDDFDDPLPEFAEYRS